MKGNSEVIKKLNELLTAELTSIDSYFVHSRVMKNLGYEKIYEQLNHEMEDEQGHASAIIERIIFLEGTPDLSKRLPFKVDRSVVNMFKTDLQFEYQNRELLVDAIELCLQQKDYATKETLEPLLVDTEEDHIDWLETQLRIIDEIGEERYLAEKI